VNEELQKQLAGYLESIASAAKSSGAFVLEQAPLVVQEKIAYGRVWETFLLVVVAIAAVIFLRMLVWGVISLRASSYHDDGPSIAATVCGGIGSFFGCIGTLAQADAAIKVWFAPRLYIIEWVMGLMNGGGK
jgi:hypothetical protein